MSNALIVVDVQNDFCEGGALAVDGGLVIADKISDYIYKMGSMYEEIIFTRDLHLPWPKTNNGHFSATPDFIDTWPPHCQVGTRGKDLVAPMYGAIYDLTLDTSFSPEKNIFSKGTGWPDYSGFQGHNKGRQSLHEYLHKNAVVNVDVVGIAGDYCVLQTALDAKRYGYTTNILENLVVSVNGPSATKAAIQRLEFA